MSTLSPEQIDGPVRLAMEYYHDRALGLVSVQTPSLGYVLKVARENGYDADQRILLMAGAEAIQEIIIKHGVAHDR